MPWDWVELQRFQRETNADRVHIISDGETLIQPGNMFQLQNIPALAKTAKQIHKGRHMLLKV